MNCGCCFDDLICACIPADGNVKINTEVDPYKEYFYRLTDKFNNVYEGAADVNPDGTLLIPINDLPAGLLNPFAGSFNLEIFYDANGCERVPLLLARRYDCISFSVMGGNGKKDSIGCEMNPIVDIGGEFSSEFN
jgi:hypothetical protein